MPQKCRRPVVAVATAVDPKSKKTPGEIDNLVRCFEGFECLVASASSVHISRVIVGDCGRDLVSWNATVLREEGRPRVVRAKSLIELFMKLVDGEREKICARCQESKPTTDFSVNRSRADGRCRNCKRCESLRVMGCQRKKPRPVSRDMPVIAAAAP
jgi:hypothetical protein